MQWYVKQDKWKRRIIWQDEADLYERDGSKHAANIKKSVSEVEIDSRRNDNFAKTNGGVK